MDSSIKQIHYLWSSYNQEKWRFDPNPLSSARKCLEKATDDIDIIPISEEPGMFSLGFALKFPLSVVGAHTEELAMDGTC